MKEYTVVTTVELTEALIMPEEVFKESDYKKTLAYSLFEELGFDKIDIKSCKVFPREVSDDDE